MAAVKNPGETTISVAKRKAEGWYNWMLSNIPTSDALWRGLLNFIGFIEQNPGERRKIKDYTTRMESAMQQKGYDNG